MNLKKCVQKDLKKSDYTIYIYMDMNIVTLPRKSLKKYDYNIDMTTLPKKGLKTRPYNIGMEKRYLKKYDYNIDMEKKDLKKLTKRQLIKLLLKQKKSKKPKVVIVDDTKSTPPPRTGKWENVKPKPVPRKSVKQMVKEYEDIIQPPEQFRDGYKQSQNQGLTDHFKCEDRQNPLESHHLHQSLKLKTT